MCDGGDAGLVFLLAGEEFGANDIAPDDDGIVCGDNMSMFREFGRCRIVA
jgi:hypothetical protein